MVFENRAARKIYGRDQEIVIVTQKASSIVRAVHHILLG
jgi:hypothetical protein